MTRPGSPFFDYNINLASFVQRAQKQLELFDVGNPESLFYAALELRMGIEARLLELLKALLRANNRPAEKIKEYRPKELLEKLSNLDENIFRASTLIFGVRGSQNFTSLRFVPITKELSADYGRVSTLLHCTFFESNEGWYAKRKLWPEYNTRSLVDYRNMLGEVAKRLDEASSGDLLTPPPFLIKLFDTLNDGAKE